MDKTKTKQVIVFGTDAQVRGIGGILTKNGVDVVEAPAVDSYQPLTTAIKQHRDADLVILCGMPLNNQVLYATQEARRLTKSPILVVMSQCRITAPSKEKVLQAGATNVLHSLNHIEDGQVALTAAKMLSISLRLERKRESTPISHMPPLPVLSETAPHHSAEPMKEPAPMPVSAPTASVQTVDQKAAVMLDLAVRLEMNAKLLREWAEEILASTKRRQGQAPQSENVLADNLLIGQMVAKGRMVTLCGETFHLPHQQVKALEILYRCRGNGGASKDLFHGIGIKTPVAVSVAMSALRKRLAKAMPGTGIRCQGGKYHLEFPLR